MFSLLNIFVILGLKFLLTQFLFHRLLTLLFFAGLGGDVGGIGNVDLNDRCEELIGSRSA